MNKSKILLLIINCIKSLWELIKNNINIKYSNKITPSNNLDYKYIDKENEIIDMIKKCKKK